MIVAKKQNKKFRLNPKKHGRRSELRDANTWIDGQLGSLDKDEVHVNSIDDLIRRIESDIKSGVAWATDFTFTALRVSIENWYNDYEPTMYIRTEMFYESPYVEVHNNSGEVGINLNCIHCPEMLANAEEGIHGSTLIIDKQTGAAFDMRRAGDHMLGVWGELIYFLQTGTWNTSNSSAYGDMAFGTYGDLPKVDEAFEAGMLAGKRVNDSGYKNWKLNR